MRKIFLFALVLLVAVGAQAKRVNLFQLPDKSTYTAHTGDTLYGSTHGKTDLTIEIAVGQRITLQDVRINHDFNIRTKAHAGIATKGNATIVLVGSNYVCGFGEKEPGIFVAKGATLQIRDGSEGSGFLHAESGMNSLGVQYGAGIGSGAYKEDKANQCGNILIWSGRIEAIGGSNAAGIGSAYESSCGNIVIDDGEVVAQGGYMGAGIGSGAHNVLNDPQYSLKTVYSKCGYILINGGRVTAQGGDYAAGIGTGMDGRCGDIYFAKDVIQVKALAGKEAPYCVGPGVSGLSGTICGKIYKDIRASVKSTTDFTVSESAGWEDPSRVECPFYYPELVCDAPKNLAQTHTHNRGTITWKSANEGSNHQYRISFRGGDNTSWKEFETSFDGPDAEYAFGNLKPETMYDVRIQEHCDGYKWSGYSYISFTTSVAPSVTPTPTPTVTCNKPKNLQVENITYNSAMIWWEKGSSTQNTWRWCIGKANESNDDFVITTGSTGISEGGLEPATTYRFSIQTVCAEGEYSEMESIEFTTEAKPCNKPSAPELIADPSYNSARIVWSRGSADQTTWTIGWAVAKEPIVWSSIVIDNTSEMPQYVINGLKPSTKYYVQVRGKCGNDWSDFSDRLTFNTIAKPECGAPYNINFSDYTPNSVTVKWTAAGNENHWKVAYRHDDDAAEWTEVDVSERSYTITNLNADDSYYVKVKAVCSLDNESEYSDTWHFYTEPEPCPAPTNVFVKPGVYDATVSWNPGSDDQNRWFIFIAKKGEAFTLETAANTPSGKIIGLRPNTEYEVKVYARCANNEESEFSQTIPFKTEPDEGLYVYSSYKDHVLTYYCDRKMGQHEGAIDKIYYDDVDRFKDYNTQVTHIVIDPSMQDTALRSMECLFGTATNYPLSAEYIEGIEYLNTSKLESTSYMFRNSGSLREIDLTDFDMSKVKNAFRMFYNCSNLTTIYCDDDWSQYDNLTNSEGMFTFCDNLQGKYGTNYENSGAKNKTVARPDGGSEAPGFFTVHPRSCVAPTQLRLENLTATTATISWTPGDEKQNLWYVGWGSVDRGEHYVYGHDVNGDAVYTIEDLEPDMTYHVAINAGCIQELVSDFSQELVFTTPSEYGAGIDVIRSFGNETRKILLNGQLYILRDGKMYTVTGQEVK